MTPLWKKRWATLALISLRIVLGCVFIFASWHKIAQPAEFARIVANYQILPPALINFTALLLPWIELLCGIGLLCGVMVRGSALIVGTLLMIFIAALVINLARGVDTHCGCFSASVQGSTHMYLDILLDIVLLTMAVVAFIFPGKIEKLGISSYTDPVVKDAGNTGNK